MTPSSRRRGTFIKAVILGAAFVLAAAWPGAAQVPDATPFDLGALPGRVFSEAHAINASGQIVGFSWGLDTASDPLPFFWYKGVMTPLPLPIGCTQGEAMSINDLGQIAGYCGDGTTYRACLWTLKRRAWTVTVLNVAEACLPDDTCLGSVATKINGAGQVLVALASTNWGGYAAIWQNGAWTVLGAAADGGGTVPLRIGPLPTVMNEKGQVLLPVDNVNEETHDLCLWDGSNVVFLAEAFDWANINNAGQIVGRRHITNPNHEVPPADLVPQNFTYDTSTKTLAFSPEGDGYSLVNINDNGQVLTAVYRAETGRTELGTTSFSGWAPGAAWSPLASVFGNVQRRTLRFNARGDVSGYSVEGGAFFASVEGGVVALEEDTESNLSDVTAMNDAGMLIGQQVSPTIHAAVLWAPGLWSTGPNVGTATVSVKVRTVTVTVPITNANQARTAEDVVINTVTLDGGILTTMLPLAVKSIPPGATVPVTFKFTTSSLSQQPWPLYVEGSCSLGSFSGSQSVMVK